MTKLAIISDVHAFHPAAGSAKFAQGDPSWVRTTPDQFEESRGPFQALEELIQANSLTADYVICCGDMGDKSDSEGILYTWGWLETIRRRLDARMLIGTTGNHDVDSRNLSGANDPTATTRALQPPFPIDNSAIRDAYWAHNVGTFTDGDVDIVVLNSAAEHASEKLASRGRISDSTFAKLRDAVASAESPKRILLTHHHPYRIDVVDKTDDSALDGGPEVLRLLQDNPDWLVIHGHRHYPSLLYAAGSMDAPVIFASGSFSAVIYPELQTRVRNQFHLVDVEAPGTVNGTSGVAGLVRSWEFDTSSGWVAPTSNEGIPDGTGFGFRGPHDTAKKLIRDFVAGKAERFVVLEDILLAHPELRYLLPADRKALLDELVSDGSLRVTPEHHYAARADEVFLS